MRSLSIIIPVLNERDSIAQSLACLFHRCEDQQLIFDRRELSSIDEHIYLQLIVVDGGSDDGTFEFLKSCAYPLTLIQSKAGRARQMNAGAQLATSDILLFLHLDTQLPFNFYKTILAMPDKQFWGRFDLLLSNQKLWAKIIASMINWRSRTFGIATGDQAIFVRRDAFFSVGTYSDLLLMEDVSLSKKLKRQFNSPYCVRDKVTTSSRRWEKNGGRKDGSVNVAIALIFLFWRV